MKRILLALVAVGVLFTSPKASALEELFRNYRGARALGMGGVAYTTGIYDESLFANPATQLLAPAWKISLLNLTGELNDNMLSDLNDVLDVTNASGADVLAQIGQKELAGKAEHYRVTVIPGFYSPSFFGENTSFGFGILVNNQTNLMLRAHTDIEMQAVLDAGPAMGVAHRFTDLGLNVGVNLRAIYRAAADRTLRATDFTSGTAKLDLKTIGTQGVGIDGDFGVLYTLPVPLFMFKQVLIGASLNNFLASEYQTFGKDLISTIRGGAPPRNDRTINAGVRFDLPDLFVFSNSLFAFEFQNVGHTRKMAGFYKKLHLGAETTLLAKWFSFRAGLNQGYLTGGVGFDLPIVNINIATYGEELGSNAGQLEDRRVLLNLEFAI